MIRNEQIKLTATFLNGMGIAVFAVGGLAPTLTGFYRPEGLSWVQLAISAASIFLVAPAMHLAALATLKRLGGYDE